MAADVEKQIDGFLSAYLPEVEAAARDARRRMRKRLPDAFEMVYDNYNALVFGYSFSERPSEAILSLAIMPQWVTLCFLFGAKFDDPKKILRGEGNQVRNIRLGSPGDFDSEDVSGFIEQAIRTSPATRDSKRPGTTVVRSISKKQRPRRPSSGPKKTATIRSAKKRA